MASFKTRQPTRRATLIGAGLLAASQVARPGTAYADEDPWPFLMPQIFKRPVEDNDSFVAIDAPYRAEDAAVVPITLHLLPDSVTHAVRAVTLVIDANPSPLAAVFRMAPEAGVTRIETRIRVDSYTNIHAVAETGDGQLFAAKRFVKAAGGCSAPALKQEHDDIPLGTMRFREFAPAQDAAPDQREAELMIRHPNYSGMQMDQITRLYIPAHFVTTLHLWQGDAPLLAVESGISIAENPLYRFTYRSNGGKSIRADAADNENKVFHGTWPVTSA